MLASILRTELLKEGRSIRIPIMLIFYNSILAFITILFIFFNNESMQVGYYTGHSSFFTQFLIISSFQIIAVFFMVPFTVSYMENTERAVTNQLLMIPGVVKHYILARIHLLIIFNLLIFVSSLPIISLSCIYSGIRLIKMIRLMGMILMFSIWCGSIAIFFYSVLQRNLLAFAATISTYFMFSIGSILFLEVVRNMSDTMMAGGEISSELKILCLVIHLFNPLIVYMGYFGNLSGNVAMMTSYFGNFGIDATSTRFSFLYYKAATFTCLMAAFVFLYLSIRFFTKEK